MSCQHSLRLIPLRQVTLNLELTYFGAFIFVFFFFCFFFVCLFLSLVVYPVFHPHWAGGQKVPAILWHLHPHPSPSHPSADFELSVLVPRIKTQLLLLAQQCST